MANIPFVSEEFQRAFRNQFPSQTSTGRDLHVSDIVIPVVDFTPTASSTSLPLDLRFARNLNTVNINTTSNNTNVNTGLSPGFILCDLNLSAVGGNGIVNLFIFDGASGYTSVVALKIDANTNTNGITTESPVVYVPTGHQLLYSTTFTGTGSLTSHYTPVADVNGNQILPSLYDPQ